MFIKPEKVTLKPYVAYAYPSRDMTDERLVITNHVSLARAKRAARQNWAKLRHTHPNAGVTTYGWTEVEPRHRKQGLVL